MVNSGLVILIWLCIISSGYGYKISLTSNGPVVVGATVTFRAEITDDRGRAVGGSYQFKWKDNAIPAHSSTVSGEFTKCNWNVTYSRELYSPGTYEVQVEISRYVIFYWTIASKRQYFELTPLLNGNMSLTQYNRTVTDYVSSALEVTHHIQFEEPDQAFLTKNATSVVAYWFVNCIYYGPSTDLTFKYNYTDAADQQRQVEALVVASFERLPPPAPNTTTPAPPTTTTSTTTPAPTTTKPTVTTTVEPSKNTTEVIQPNIKLGTNVSEIPILPYVCLNTSIVPPDPKKTYGYFSAKVDVKAPVSNVLFHGNNWLQHGEILNLSVSCNGSAPFLYCFMITEGEYNITGNETCFSQQTTLDCQVTLPRYFHHPGVYTVLIIISNQVSKKITPLGINVYEVKKHPQLSVIVVPVACSAIAVILVVFGAAHYIQNRHRYTIEVADFDFAQTSDLEYMTFTQRLKAALNHAFNRNPELNYSRLDDNQQGRY